MKKVLALLVSLLTATLCVTAADVANISLDAGYNNYYTVNGVAYAKDAAYAGIGAVKGLKYADVYVGGLLVADQIGNGGTDQSHWLVGVGKSVALTKNFGLRLDGTVTRHQTEGSGIKNSTEVSPKLALTNPYVTPYVRGSFNFELEQNGYFVGAERVQKLFWGFTVTPSVEYGKLTDYEAIAAKAVLARSFNLGFGVLTPYASVGWYDNNFSESATKFALVEFDKETVYSAGIKLSF